MTQRRHRRTQTLVRSAWDMVRLSCVCIQYVVLLGPHGFFFPCNQSCPTVCARRGKGMTPFHHPAANNVFQSRLGCLASSICCLWQCVRCSQDVPGVHDGPQRRRGEGMPVGLFVGFVYGPPPFLIPPSCPFSVLKHELFDFLPRSVVYPRGCVCCGISPPGGFVYYGCATFW